MIVAAAVAVHRPEEVGLLVLLEWLALVGVALVLS